MSNDEKIDEVLRIVKGHEARFDRLEGKLGLLEAKDNEHSHQITSLRDMFLEERQVNNARFFQLSSGLDEVRKDVVDLKVGLKAVDAKIDHVRESLSADINAFGEELYETRLRVKRLGKKQLS